MVVVVAIVVAVLVTSRPGHDGTGGTGGTGTTTTGAGSTQATQSGAASGARAHGTSAADTLAAAVQRSIGEKTATIALAATYSDPGQSTPQRLDGNGRFDLGSGLGTLDVTLTGTTTEGQQFVFQGQPVYVHVTDSPVPGKSWVVATTNDLPALGPASTLSNLIELIGNPGMLLQHVADGPLVVASLGRTTVDGKDVQSYSVNFSSNATTMAAAGFGTHAFEEVDVGSDGRVRLIVIPGPSNDGNGQTVHQDVVVSFSHYGSALSVATPPSSQVLSLSQYLTRP